ncbi:MAG: DsrE family protein [Burkholderiaceae bacterium]
MRTLTIRTLAIAAVGLSSLLHHAFAAGANAPIASYGEIVPLPGAGVQPSAAIEYRAVFDLTKPADDPASPLPGLVQLAKAVNLFAFAGTPLSHLRLIAVIHSDATTAVLDEQHYQQAYQRPNPNLPLIAQLRQAGVQVHVCGQALHEHKIDHQAVASDVQIDLSALTTIIGYGVNGYPVLSR